MKRNLLIITLILIFLTTGYVSISALKNKEFYAKQTCAQNKDKAEEKIKLIKNINADDFLYMNEIIFSKKTNSCIYSYSFDTASRDRIEKGIYDYFSNEVIFSCQYEESHGVPGINLQETIKCQKNHYDKIEELKK